MGDYYNLNLLNHQNHNASVELLDGFYSFMFPLLISVPPRIISHTATCINNIFTNYFDFKNQIGGLLFSDIWDHLPVIIFFYLLC